MPAYLYLMSSEKIDVNGQSMDIDKTRNSQAINLPKGLFFQGLPRAQAFSLRCLISFNTVLSLNLGAQRSTALNSELCFGSNSINSERL